MKHTHDYTLSSWAQEAQDKQKELSKEIKINDVDMSSLKLTIIGAGSYGTSLAITVASKGCKVCLYARNQEQAKAMEQNRENSRYLPNIKFPPSLQVTNNLEEAVNFCKDILIVVPSAAFVSTIQQLKPFLNKNCRLAWATKGLEYGTGEFLSTVIERELLSLPFYKEHPLPLIALSGPTFAKELALHMPTAIACASLRNDEVSNRFIEDFCTIMHTKFLRVYISQDIRALQIGGAVKNVIAIAAGMSDGLGFGANARTALISRGLAEMIRLGVALNASERGFMGLSGLGDLMLTCTDNQSRNRRFGFLLGTGKSVDEALQEIGQVVEGYHIFKDVCNLAKRHQVDMPICFELSEVLQNKKTGKEAAQSLLGRALTVE